MSLSLSLAVAYLELPSFGNIYTMPVAARTLGCLARTVGRVGKVRRMARRWYALLQCFLCCMDEASGEARNEHIQMELPLTPLAQWRSVLVGVMPRESTARRTELLEERIDVGASLCAGLKEDGLRLTSDLAAHRGGHLLLVLEIGLGANDADDGRLVRIALQLPQPIGHVFERFLVRTTCE